MGREERPERTEQVRQEGRAERTEQTGQAGRTEQTEQAGRMERTEQTRQSCRASIPEQVEEADRMNRSEQVKLTDRVTRPEQAEQVNRTERKRFRLTVAYDGTAYSGWQWQPRVETVEGVLNRCLSDLTGEPVTMISASRTDAGVHAYGNIAVFDSSTSIPAERLPYALNQKLPEDIRVRKGELVNADFHPRRRKSRKTYEYRICCSDFPLPTERLYSYFTHRPPDLERMRKAAGYLVGEHDFTSFCSARTEKENKVRTLYTCEIRQEGHFVIVRVSGNGFLYNMVRIVAGTLLKAGQGGMEPEQIPEILAACDRRLAGPTLPPQGLFLVEIKY